MTQRPETLQAKELHAYNSEIRQRRRLTPEGEIVLAKFVESANLSIKTAACSCPVTAQIASYLATKLERHEVVPRRIFANTPLNGHSSPDSPDRIEEMLHRLQGVRANFDALASIERSLQSWFLSGISRSIHPGVQKRILRHRNRIRSLVSEIPFAPQVEETIAARVKSRLDVLKKVQDYLAVSAQAHGVPAEEFHHWWLCGRFPQNSKIPAWIFDTRRTTGKERLWVAQTCGSLASDAASFQRNASLLETAERMRRFAVHEITECNMRLVLRYANKNSLSPLPIADRIQTGSIGLMRAAEKFDWRQGYRFSTYASNWIQQQIQRGLYENLHTIKKPAHIIDAEKRIVEIRHRAYQNGENLSNDEIARQVGIKLEVLESLDRNQDSFMSLDESFGSTEGEEGALVSETLADEDSVTAEEQAAQKERQNKILEAVLRLPRQMREFCMLRFALPHPEHPIVQKLQKSRKNLNALEIDLEEQSLKQISVLWKISQDAVRQVEQQTMLALQTPELRNIAGEI